MKVPYIISQLFGICLLHLSFNFLHGQVNVLPKLPEKMEEASSSPSSNQQQVTQEEEPFFPDRAAEILEYWFGDLPNPAYFPENKIPLWLVDTPEMGRELNENFAQDVSNAQKGDYNRWRATPKGRLALIILLDQIPRHIYRDKSQAFSSDMMARALAIEGIQKGDDKQLYPIERAFFYLPLEHAEDPAIQNMSVDAYRRLLLEAPMDIKPEIQDFLDYALAHQQQIDRFGRFPARNAILGRKSTPEELLFLHQSGRSNY